MHDKIMYRNATYVFLEYKFRKPDGCRIKKQKSTAFLYNSINQLEKNNINSRSYTITCVGINTTYYVLDLYI